MKILSAKNSSGKKLSENEIQWDYDDLKAAHEKATKENPTWAFFGGVIKLGNGHTYQVC